MQGSPSPRANRLLGLLGDSVYSELGPELERCRFKAGTIIHAPGDVMRYAVFPVSGLVGRVATTSEGKSTEFTLCGAEGMIGLAIILGASVRVGTQALVHVDTLAYRLPAAAIHAVWRKYEDFQSLMLRYVRATIREITQVALCNKHHTVEQQLSRWLLTAMHRTNDTSLLVTQSVIAQMLGVRREGITEAAGKLHQLGVVRRVRGGIKVVDREALLARSCECYSAVTGSGDALVSKHPKSRNGRHECRQG